MRDAVRCDGAVCLAALHDVGKVSPGFQTKCLQWATEYGMANANLLGAESDHARISQRTLQEWLGPDSLRRLWAAVLGAHHGRLKGDRLPQLCDGGDAWARERERLIRELISEFGPLPDAPPSGSSPWNSGALWFTAGLIAVADWLASDERTFPPAKPLQPAELRVRAAGQIERLGFAPPSLPVGLPFRVLFPFPPTPLQQAVADLPAEPGLYVIEAPMGCGKTEAALVLAYNLISRGQANGLYFALPTQVTSNRIHERVQAFLASLNPGISTRLAHANSWLLADETPLVSTQPDGVLGSSGRYEGSRDWFASPKRALLAPYGVGTVDQALLGVVAAKHFFVRQYALAGKIVILDEVHSYDLYTGTLIDVLIHRLAELGAVVIVISATLTAARRRQLLGQEPNDTPDADEPYPLVSVADAHGVRALRPPAPVQPARTVAIRFVGNDTVVDACLERASRGECVLWIRNTVDDAQQTWRDLMGLNLEGGPEIGLLHARFPFFRRDELEEKWLGVLGKGGQRPRRGCVLVSTQVAEQSIDIDADLLITDLAPTDMLLQRIGRLWRHERPRPPGATCQAWILEPGLAMADLWQASVPQIRACFGRSAKVYAPYVLLRTFALWHRLDAIALPDAIRKTLEGTYAVLGGEPSAWRELWVQLLADRERLRRKAETVTRLWDNPALEDTEDVQTRWNALPTAALLPVTAVQQGNDQRGVQAVLLDGTPAEMLCGDWDPSVARAVHRNLVKVPLWTVREATLRTPRWLRTYVAGAVAAAQVMPDGSMVLQPSAQPCCLSYTSDTGVSVQRQSAAAVAAWSTHTEDDDEFDD